MSTQPHGYDAGTMVFDHVAAHACNCIGCCRVCGHCRTDPRHTLARCEATRKARAQRAAIWR